MNSFFQFTYLIFILLSTSGILRIVKRGGLCNDKRDKNNLIATGRSPTGEGMILVACLALEAIMKDQVEQFSLLFIGRKRGN